MITPEDRETSKTLQFNNVPGFGETVLQQNLKNEV